MGSKVRPGKRVKYTAKQLQDAYQAWARLDPEKIDLRTAAWHRYCDVRDGVPLGTSAKVYLYGDHFLGHAALGLHDD